MGKVISQEPAEEILARYSREATEGAAIEVSTALWVALGRTPSVPAEEIYDRPLGAAETTVEALMYCARKYGPDDFSRPANIERLSRCSEAQKKSMIERMRKLGIVPPQCLLGEG